MVVAGLVVLHFADSGFDCAVAALVDGSTYSVLVWRLLLQLVGSRKENAAASAVNGSALPITDHKLGAEVQRDVNFDASRGVEPARICRQ